MAQGSDYYVVRSNALPEVLRKVVEAKRLLQSSEKLSIAEAAERLGISRSSYYKYKDDIFPFYDNSKGKTVTLVIQMIDELGGISRVCSRMAAYEANILTIHQSIPVNNVATLTVSAEVSSETRDISDMIREIEAMDHVQYVKILAQESNLTGT